MDERYLETIPEVESLYSRRSSVATNLPELPFRAVPPMTEEEYAYSNSNEIVSPTINTTFYSQQHPSSIPSHTRSESGQQSNVSPISTQESFHANGSDASLVSPIEASFPTPTQQMHSEKSTSRSQIPRKLPVPETQKSPDDTSIPKKWSLRERTDGETRWDEYSGEPNQAGKPPSVRPGAQPPLEHQYPQLKERTRQILAGLREREAVKKATWGTPVSEPDESDPLDNPVQRPPWKGASGRHAIVEPVKNTPSARIRPLALQRRRQKKGGETAESETGRSVTPEQAEHTPRSPIDAVSVAASKLSTIKPSVSEESIKPVVPLKLRNTPRVLSPTQNTLSLDSPFQSPSQVWGVREISASPAPSTSTVQENGADSPTLGTTPGNVAADMGSRGSAESVETTITQHQQPTIQREQDTTSSWNTYTTTTTTDTNNIIPSSPTPHAQLTSSPDSISSKSWSTTNAPVSVPDPIVLRKRVAANNSGRHKSHINHSYYASTNSSTNSISPFSTTTSRRSSGATILRKAIGKNDLEPDKNDNSSTSPHPPVHDKPRAVSLMSGLSSGTGTGTGKSLPPTPSELEAADKAASLQARLDDLSRRKRNLNKIIAELRDSLKRNAIVYDARKRKEVDKMIINLNLELQDITNEEHETALRLHRVRKRRDKDDFYEEPTGLWIKRVTT
ncbi:hypothetical protein A1O1_04741 [Capronia coronata CBS 617.96]|uniref:Uncharacterized protein n=1 Tax=Capronia coronata CBS 617.96 TaxID=1182541 RepID=W9YZU3_9EURO|nr:uncharacterized protein A1O1_04741 [Capronia coronata CBS 617.96]EXJ87814.1 hypothetical protein A1O1_04741 [Capronia coronata CBS 617.96]